MIGVGLAYIMRHPTRAVRALARSPAEAFTRAMDIAADYREQKSPLIYTPDVDWESRFHYALGAPWPCRETEEFWGIWPSIVERLQAAGIEAGPLSFSGWNDGDPGLVRAAWCLVRHTRVRRVIETGVAHGVTSCVILEAMRRNSSGHLWSIDLPPFNPQLRKEVGVAVEESLRHRWTYLEGSSRRRLAGLMAELGSIDLFVHDSLHSARNLLFEMNSAWRVLRPGGVILADDIDVNTGFSTFTNDKHVYMVCEAEPLRPDPRRFNKKGLFGIVKKT